MAERHSGVQDAHPGLYFLARGRRIDEQLPAAEPCEDDFRPEAED